MYRHDKILKTDFQKKTWSIFTLECIFRKIGPFSNFRFQEKLMNKWPHVAYKKQPIILLLQIANKLQVDIFKITPRGRSQQQVIKKNPLCISLVAINPLPVSVISSAFFFPRWKSHPLSLFATWQFPKFPNAETILDRIFSDFLSEKG